MLKKVIAAALAVIASSSFAADAPKFYAGVTVAGPESKAWKTV
ncbi:hypothetical protein [Massilia sp. TSP1-1-2]